MGAEGLRRAVMDSGGVGILLLVYKIVLEKLYLHYVLKFGWGAPYTADLGRGTYWESWVACAAILFIFRSTMEKPLSQYRCSEFILLVLLLVSVLPGMAMCGVGAFPPEYTRLFYGYWLLFFAIIRGFSLMKENGFILTGRLSHSARECLLLGIGAIVLSTVLFVFVYYNGGKFFVAGIQSSEVYAVRLQFREIVMPVVLNYIMANASIVLLLLLMYFLQCRRYKLALMMCLAQYMNFSCGANKVILLSTLAIIAVYALGYVITVKKLIGVGIVTLVASAITVDMWNNFFLLSFIVRLSFLPALLNYCYYDFFQIHAPMMDMFLGEATIDSANITFMIGGNYLGNVTDNANNGLFGDAARLFGDWGVILHPLLWSVYLYFLDKASDGIDWKMRFGIGIYWAVVMQDGFITRSMLTRGGVALMGLVYLMKKIENKTKHNAKDVNILGLKGCSVLK